VVLCGQVLVPIGFGTEEMEAVIIIDVLRRAGADVTVASVEPQLEIEASIGTKLVADTSISTCSDQVFDLVALPVSFLNHLILFVYIIIFMHNLKITVSVILVRSQK
jgi:hypothetical protein